MSMTPEGKVKEKVKKLLKSMGIYYHMPVQNGMGSPSLDFICCAWGRYLAIETKAPKEVPTERQKITMQEISTSGGMVFVVRDDETLAMLEATLRLMQPCLSQNLSSGLRVVGPTETSTTSRKRSPKSARNSTSSLSTDAPEGPTA